MATKTAVTAAIAGLGLYFLVSPGHGPADSTSAASGGAFTAPAGHVCTKPAVIPADPKNAQSGIAKGKYFVTNDTWNADRYPGLSQALYVCNYNSWYTIATMDNDTSDGAVKTSPNVQETWSPTPAKLSQWTSITSKFSDVPPGIGPDFGIWEFAYDIWLNGLADSASTEVMIWTDNNGQTPGGSPVGTFSEAGRTYDVYRRPPPVQYVAFVDRSNRLAGSLNLADFFRYVISRGWIPDSSTLYQICNGVELVSTNARPEKFTVNDFSITMKPSA